MEILPLHPDLERYLKVRRLGKKFAKQKNLFVSNWRHPSLHTELLEPKEMKIFSFRIDDKYRVIFIFHDSETVEIIDINNHYQ